MSLDDGLFRRESARIVAALTRLLGPQSLALAEDVAQDAFCRALEVWSLRGVPENPSAWLMLTAKNRAFDILRRQRTARTFAPELAAMLQDEWALAATVEDLFAPGAMKDDLLRMMFSCCDPRLPEQTQVALILQVLCGFGASEVANAFMSGRAAMEKRLVRAKKVLATSNALFDVTAPSELANRLDGVQRALYLLFNEGYHGGSSESAVREELCREAMRLTALLAADPRCARPSTFALGALMCLHAARMPSRTTPTRELVPLADQDRALWNQELIADGLKLLELAACGSTLTEFHLEAAIAAYHATAPSSAATDWGAIVMLYDCLLRIRPSPVVALSRAVAVGQRDGPGCGLAEIRAIDDGARLTDYPFYFAALGEFAAGLGDAAGAAADFRRALAVARNPMERRFLEQRLQGRVPEDHDIGSTSRVWDEALSALTNDLEPAVERGPVQPPAYRGDRK